jgi:predicted ATPase
LKLQRLHIKNFKSIVDLEIIEPNPFTVFVGPNGSGKSNIFEALEFWSLFKKYDSWQILSLHGGKESINNSVQGSDKTEFNITELENGESRSSLMLGNSPNEVVGGSVMGPYGKRAINKPFSIDVVFLNFCLVFVKNLEKQRLNYIDSIKLNLSCSNLEKVLKRILQDESKREEILEILQLLVPELENIEVYSDNISGQETLLIKEKNTSKPFGKSLISDGTYNILCLLTAIYQSDEPQFLCIEEPENGLSPYAIELLVELIRNKCEEKGHYIWLNTHSPTLVRQLRANELILVDKKDGSTQIKQFEGKDFHGLSMDEAWLTNALGGGLPW